MEQGWADSPPPPPEVEKQVVHISLECFLVLFNGEQLIVVELIFQHLFYGKNCNNYLNLKSIKFILLSNESIWHLKGIEVYEETTTAPKENFTDELKTFHTFGQQIEGQIIPVERMANLGQILLFSTGIMTPATKFSRFIALTIMGECTGERNLKIKKFV